MKRRSWGSEIWAIYNGFGKFSPLSLFLSLIVRVETEKRKQEQIVEAN
jgi:hypothetical protein